MVKQMRNYVTGYEEAVEFIYRIPRFNPNHSIDKIKQFLARMGQPDRQMKIVHIAGTNGKGSTSAYLAGLLEESGLKVGLFTSPHLLDMRERIRINGQLVSKDLFTEAVQYVLKLLEQQSEECREGFTPCFFDVLFFMAMYVFVREKVDIVVLETGLGGTLDATNSVLDKVLTLITHIALDHTEYLGSTKELIAAEKAGIMMRGVPCVVGRHNEEVLHVFKEKAAELDVRCRILEKEDYTCHGVSQKAVAFSYFSRYYGNIPITLNTSALYQVDNASLALAGAEALIDQGIIEQYQLNAASISRILGQVRWEGRLEEISDGVFLDGAHNMDGLQALLETVAQDGCKGKRILIFSALADKDLQEMTSVICEADLFQQIIVTQLQEKRAADAVSLKTYFEEAEPRQKVYLEKEPEKALKLALDSRKEDDHIYVAGSLYLVSCMKKLQKTERCRIEKGAYT